MQIEFQAGQEVWIIHNNSAVATRIRAVEHRQSLEVSNSADGKALESINESVKYSTLLLPNKTLAADRIGSSKEELIKKVFGE